MKTPRTRESAKSAILVLVEIKAAVEAFDRGDVNVLVALEAVRAAVATGPAVVRAGQRPPRTGRRAA